MIQQDSALCHESNYSTSWLDANDIVTLLCRSKSPDPIEKL